VCLNVNKQAVDEPVEQISKKGGETYPDIFDVRNAKDTAQAVDNAKKLLGWRLDGRALGVGISRGLLLLKITHESRVDELAVNL
jgi:hypothetical protein